jgi:AMP-binding enzyme
LSTAARPREPFRPQSDAKALNRSPLGVAVTLDQILMRTAARQPDAAAMIALDGAPVYWRTLAQDVARMAGVMQAIGLSAGSVIGVQVADPVRRMATMFGAFRAGLVVTLIPPGWRRHDIVRAATRHAIRALFGDAPSNETLRDVAGECFTIRFVCGFGADVPDGVLPLHTVLAEVEPLEPAGQGGDAARRPCLVTFEATGPGTIPVARNALEILAAGLPVLLETRMPQRARIVTLLAPGSIAAVATAIVPWLLTGGTLVEMPGHSAAPGATWAGGDVLVVPGALSTRADVVAADVTLVAVWKAPERYAAAQPLQALRGVIDLLAFGETGLVARTRGGTSGLPLGEVHAPSTPGGAALLETGVTSAGTLALRGAMVPQKVWPPHAERGGDPCLTLAEDGFVETRQPIRQDRAAGLLFVESPVPGTVTIGGARVSMADAADLLAGLSPDASLTAVPDAVLGSRLVGVAADRRAVHAALIEAGAHPLIAAAFRPRQG